MTSSLRPFGRHEANDVAAFGGDGALTAAALCTAALRVADRLGPSAGDEVVVVCRDRAAFAAALFGAWEAGYGVALPPNVQPETLRELRQRPAVRTVLHDGEGAKGVDVRSFLPSASDACAGELSDIGGERHLAIHTSGTTGETQRCVKPSAALLAEVDVLERTFAELPGSRVLAIVPPHHIYGLLFGLLVPSFSGGAFHRRGPRDPDAIRSAIAADGATVVVSVPAHLRSLRHSALETLPGVQRVFSSGAPLPSDTAGDFARRANWPITEVLGSTETGGIAWRTRGSNKAPPWQPFDGVRVAADHEEGLRLQSPFLPSSLSEPYAGADRIRVLPDGRFEHLGRRDGVLKVGAMRVSVADLKRRLLEIPGVRDAEVIPVTAGGARGVETWAALVAPDLDAIQVRSALSPWFAAVVLPRRYRFVDRLPRSDHGKASRADLLALFESPSADAPPLHSSTSQPSHRRP